MGKNEGKIRMMIASQGQNFLEGNMEMVQWIRSVRP